MSDSPIVIVGAGISGLTCAWLLKTNGLPVQVLESSSGSGGIIQSEKRNGYLIERGPQSFSATPNILSLCRGLGIEQELLQAPAGAPRFILRRGKLARAPLSPLSFFASGLFSLGTKFSVLNDLFGQSVPPVAEESVASFVRRKFSPELLDRLVAPFVSGIYAGDPEKLSLQSAFPQVYEAEKSAGSVIRGMLRSAKSRNGGSSGPVLSSFRNGNETLSQSLAAALGPSVKYNSAVQNISRTDSGAWRLALHGNTVVESSHLVLAVPAFVAAKLLQKEIPALAGSLSGISYPSVAVVSTGYLRSNISNNLHGFGFLIPRSEGLRTLGTVWNSSLFPNRAPQNHVLLTSFLGGAADPETPQKSDSSLTSLVHSEISPILGIKNSPVFSEVTVYQQAIPQYNLGHSEILSEIALAKNSLPGLWLTGNYFSGPAIGACIDHALSVAESVQISYKS